MRFGLLILKTAIPQWRACYIDYRLLKSLLTVILSICDVKHLHNQTQVTLNEQQASPNQLIKMAEECNMQFFKLHREEMDVTFLFFQLKLIELKDKMHDFQRCSFVLKGDERFLYMLEALYIEASYVRNLYENNLEGERKILKKQKKVVKELGLPKPMSLSHQILRLTPVVKHLTQSIQDLYISKSLRPHKQARLHLRQLIKNKQQDTVGSFFFGMGIGVGIALIGLIIALQELAVKDSKFDDNSIFTRDFPVWRGISFFIIYMWILAIDVYMFERHHISHKLIFKFNDYHASTYTEAFYRASIFSAVYLVLFLLYVIQLIYGEFFLNCREYLGGVVWIMLIFYVIVPLKIFNWKGRLFMWKMLGLSFISICNGAEFPVIWTTDQIISLVSPFKDLAYTFCYYTQMDLSRNDVNKCAAKIQVVFVAGCIASTLRILQCIRIGYDAKQYLWTASFFNTLKYISNLLTLLFSYLYTADQPNIFSAWVAFAVVSTVWSFYWDLKMDWGLLTSNCKYRFLRDDLSYGGPKIYYFMIVMNFLLRLSWVFTLSPSIVASFKIQPVLFSLLTGTLEICRRGLWNLLRVEKQHLANCESFKAISPADPKIILQEAPKNMVDGTEEELYEKDRQNLLLQSLRKRVNNKKDLINKVENFIIVKKEQIKKLTKGR